MCEVDSKFALLTDEYFNLDIAGFTVNINSNAFNHIERRHGINGIADSSMANLNDVARIGYVIENRDSLDTLIVNGEQVYSAEFSTKEGSPAPMMLIKKRINGSYYCAIAVTDARYKKIWVQTAFINKKDGLTQILHDEISSLSLTSETVAASHPSINSIPDNSENVNDSDKKSDNRYSKSKKNSSSEPKLVMSEDGNGLKLDYDPLAELHGEDAEDTRFPNVWKSQQRSIVSDEPKLKKRISDEGKLKKYTKKEAMLYC